MTHYEDETESMGTNQTDSYKSLIKQEFIQQVREHGQSPASPYNLMAELGESETVFYSHYASLLSIEQEIWKDYISEIITRLRSEEVYHEYSVREKLLAFYFTLVEVLKENRSFVVSELSPRNGGFRKKVFEDFKEHFYEFIKELLHEGMETGEVQERMLISKKYASLLWAETEFLLRFWIKDESKNFEQTDAAIEKTVNFAMDLIGRNFADSAVDFVKFLFQRK